MMDVATEYWNALQSCKSYLPVTDARQARSYVVLACRIYRPEALHISGEDKTFDYTTQLPTDDNGQYDCQSDSCPSRALSPAPQPTLATEASNSFSMNIHNHSVSSNNTNDVNCARNNLDLSILQLRREQLNPTTQICPHTPSSHARGEFDVMYFMFRKTDVRPPSVKYMLAQKKLRHCLFACERAECKCEAPHVKPDAWRLNLNSLTHQPLLVSFNGQNRRLTLAELIPTAGYFFSLGLKHLGIVQAVIPIICKLNSKCRYGGSCLYIHSCVHFGYERNLLYNADAHSVPTSALLEPSIPHATLPLRKLYINVPMDVTPEDKLRFFDFLAEEGMATVGDVQVMGVAAFELLARRMPTRWAEAFLAVTVLRNLDLATPLETMLAMFPKVTVTVNTLPTSLRTVADLLSMTVKQFHSLDISPRVMNACEIIRNRYDNEGGHRVISLDKVQTHSLITRVMHLITSFHPTYTHCSWRKHDPTRPVVTCVLTFVDVHTCQCSLCACAPAEASQQNSSLPCLIQADETPSLRAVVEGDDTTADGTSIRDRCASDNTDGDNRLRCEALLECAACDVCNKSTHSARGSDVANTLSGHLDREQGAPVHDERRASGGQDMSMSPLSSALRLGVPENSWCTCPRQGVVAVNYELSTPSGSRCSEQNAMGKLASMGVPTWSVREVFVHGVHHAKEVNPLFPCGVCENMLRKVNHDVNDRYGCDVILHMFDSQKPRRIVYLPIPAISHRDGIDFRRFANEDLSVPVAPHCVKGNASAVTMEQTRA